MKYEAPDFIKVVNNLNNSFTGSPSNCSESVGMAFEEGETLPNGIPCGPEVQWAVYSNNCWLGLSE